MRVRVGVRESESVSECVRERENTSYATLCHVAQN